MRHSSVPVELANVDTPKGLITLGQIPLYIIASKTKRRSDRESIPIKQYSNKFFRQKQFFHDRCEAIDNYKMSQHKRFNTLMKKKQLLCKQTPRRIFKEKVATCQNKGQASAGSFQLSKKRNRKRAVTEVEPPRSFLQNPENSIIELQQQLVISSATFSNLLSHEHSITEVIQLRSNKNADNIFKMDSIGKISQSRGLELFSKLYIKDKSMMIQKLRDSRRLKKTVHIAHEVVGDRENSIEAKKIFPIQKSKKMGYLLKGLDSRPKIARTPMHTIENRFGSLADPVSVKEKQNFNDSVECFQLNGWETTL